MLIDTGADYTLIPRYTATLLGLDLEAGVTHTAEGVGGKHQTILLQNVRVKVGEFERKIPVGVVSGIPPLMGRHLFFETFSVLFDKRRAISFQK